MSSPAEKSAQRKRKVLYKCALSNTISEVLAEREGWQETRTEDWQFFWVTREWMTTQFDRYRFGEKQLVCHFRNDFELTRKDYLVKNIKKAKRGAAKLDEFDFMPSSYVLPAEYHLFVEEFRKYPANTIWIMKPVAGSQGRGIFLFRKLKQVQEWKKKDVSCSDVLPYVVQCYVHNPYLIGGKKFDSRIYVLVTSFRPLHVWVHRDGFARFSHSRYDTTRVDDAFVHLTNVAVAKTASDYDPERGLKWSLHRLFRYFRARHSHSATMKLMEKIAKLIHSSLRSVQSIIIQNERKDYEIQSLSDTIMRSEHTSACWRIVDTTDHEKDEDSHCFELYGYDILFDDSLKPWLLEVNASPSLTASSQEDLEMKKRVLNQMLDVLDLEKRRTGTELQVGGFDALILNNELVYRCPSCLPDRAPPIYGASVNLHLGDLY